MCELYDRPAEIYAFDPVEGVRTLRVFHSSRSDARPPMRLSYYGGGHYDSVVGPGWEANLLREPPGTVEVRRIEVSRALVTAAAAAGGAPGAAPSAAVSAEDAALAAALAASREQFDEAAENIDAALLSIELAASQAESAAAPGGAAAAAGAPAAATLESQILQQVLRTSALDDDTLAVQALVMEQTRAAAEAEALRAAMAASLAEAGGGASQTPVAVPAVARPSDQGEDPELREAMALSLTGGVQPTGELDALYNLGLDLTEDQQLARLLQMSRDEDVQRARRTRLAQDDMQSALLRQHERHPDNVAESALVSQGGGAASGPAGQGGGAADLAVVAGPAVPDADSDEDAMLQAALAASLEPPP